MSIRRLFSVLAAITILTTAAHAQLYEHVQTLYDELGEISQVVASRDGQNLYVANHSAMLVYQISPLDGALSLLQTLGREQGSPENFSRGQLEIAPNGNFAYLMLRREIRVYSRSNENGALTKVQTADSGTATPLGLLDIDIVDDGSQLLAVGIQGLIAYDIDEESGRLNMATDYRGDERLLPTNPQVVDLRVNPDGTVVLVSLSNSLIVLQRSIDTGTLEYSLTLGPTDFPNKGGFLYATVYFSNDGRNAYLLSGDDMLHVLDFDLAIIQSIDLPDGIPSTFSIFLGGLWLSPDARFVYVHSQNVDGVLQLTRDPQTGLLTKTAYYAASDISVGFGTGAESIAGTADTVFIAAPSENAIAYFPRSEIDGSLSDAVLYRGEDGLEYVERFETTKDGEKAYALSWRDDALTTFQRNPVDGSLEETDVNRDDMNFAPKDGGIEYVDFGISDDGRTLYGPTNHWVTLHPDTGIPVAINSSPIEIEHVELGKHGADKLYLTKQEDDYLRPADLVPTTGEPILAVQQARFVGTCGGMKISPDGSTLYFVNLTDNTLEEFFLDGESLLIPTNSTPIPSTPAESDKEIWDIEVSPDGKQIFVLIPSQNALHIFDRDSSLKTTARTPIDIAEFENFVFSRPLGLIASRDNIHVIVKTQTDSILLFRRDADSGAVSFVAKQRLSLDGAFLPVFTESADGLYIYDGSSYADGVRVHEKRVAAKVRGRIVSLNDSQKLASSIAGAVLALSKGDTDTTVAVADMNGRYSFDALAEGTYSARLMAPGYEPKDLPAFTFTGDDINLGRTFMRRHEMNSKLVGTVTRSDSGLVVPGVRVEVQGGGFATDHTYTSANGNYEFVFADTKGTNDATLSITEDDFAPYDTTATLLQDAETRVDIILDPIATTGAGGLSGTVNGPDSAVPFPQLTFTGPMRFTLSGDAIGHYTATGLTPGIYIVRVSAVGYAGRSHYVNVAAEKPYTRDFTLATGDFSDPSEDGVINSIDIQSVINAVLEGANAGSTGNVNGDDQVNAVDIQMIINAVLLGS